MSEIILLIAGLVYGFLIGLYISKIKYKKILFRENPELKEDLKKMGEFLERWGL